jgi:hypothetical protein
MSGAPIPSGDIQFYDRYKPALQAGETPYTLTAKQTLTSTAGASLSQAPSATAQFWISAPRFALDPSEIQSLFPPANSSGHYDLTLANIVLKERSLPWEREVEPNSPNTPWLALLVFAEDEILLPGSATGLTNPTRASSCAVSEFIKSTDPTILDLNLPAQPGDPATCQTIQISTATFDTIVPRIDDLPWLAHVRQVNTDNKTTAQAIGNGWFSVVIANRFPTESSGTAARYIAHLVSLEGYADYLTDTPPTWPTGVTTARLVSLASWTFQSRPDGLDFTALLKNLTGAPGGADLRLRLPGPATAPAADTPAANAASALDQGYAALPYETRVGDETFAWYHGPLVPYPVGEVTAVAGPYTSASAATVYEPASGTFDLSYAACWEVGRLLALRDRAYATAQQRSNAALATTVNLLRERARWKAGAPHAALLKPQRVSRSLGGALRVLASSIPQPGQPVTAPPQGRPAAPPKPPAFEALSAVFADPALADTIGAQIADAPPQSPTDSVVDWLAKLRLLEPVPFVHLVPDARMLPAESIRFFYIDSNSLDALSDGAQSIGVGTSRDAAQVQLARPAMREAVIVRASARRATLIGQATPAVLPTDPVAGFLLRSAAVSGWPGLEVKAWSDMAGTQEILPLRFDHVASDVLLVLYPQLPVRIDVEEPKEGLAFGVEDEWAVDLRYVSGTDVGVQIPNSSATLDASYRPGGVLQVNAWQAHLATLFPNDSAIWGPAAFALQMVNAPEQMVFDNGSAAS